jgi:hypothetical protein
MTRFGGKIVAHCRHARMCASWMMSCAVAASPTMPYA